MAGSQACPGCGRPFHHNAAPCSAVIMDTYGPGGDATLNCVFRARLVGDPVLVPADDVAELRWFSAGELPGRDEIAFANTAEALRRWLAG